MANPVRLQTSTAALLLTALIPGSLYVYAPNKGAPVFFAATFAVSAIGHFWQC